METAERDGQADTVTMTKNSQRSRKRRGFTLIEALIGIMIMAMVMGGAYALMVQAMQMSRKARDHYVAINICKNRLERARNFQYSDLRFLSENTLVVDENGNPNTAGNYRRTTTVNTNYSANLTQMTVTCQIRDYRSGTWGPVETVSSLYTKY
jgi:prepilin-type N-terminal cleavage/methylation domain-containing protein